MTGIPILAVVANFTFSTAPRHKLGTHPTSTIQSQVKTPRCYTSIPSYVPQYKI